MISFVDVTRRPYRSVPLNSEIERKYMKEENIPYLGHMLKSVTVRCDLVLHGLGWSSCRIHLYCVGVGSNPAPPFWHKTDPPTFLSLSHRSLSSDWSSRSAVVEIQRQREGTTSPTSSIQWRTNEERNGTAQETLFSYHPSSPVPPSDTCPARWPCSWQWTPVWSIHCFSPPHTGNIGSGEHSLYKRERQEEPQGVKTFFF